MNKGTGLFIGLIALFAGESVHAACPGTQVMVYTDINDATGHVFEVYKANGISWDDAADCADDISVGGATGHLATITSSSENQWVIDQLLNPSLSLATPLQQSQVWVGGAQDASATGVGDGWRWVNSEGPFSGTNNNPAMPGYTNWAGSEPNDGIVSASETYADWIEDRVELPVVHTMLPSSLEAADAILRRLNARVPSRAGAATDS